MHEELTNTLPPSQQTTPQSESGSVTSTLPNPAFPSVMPAILSMTEQLFHVEPRCAWKLGDSIEDDYIVVTVSVDTAADPREMATRQFEWHGKKIDLNRSNEPAIRLKVVYQ